MKDERAKLFSEFEALQWQERHSPTEAISVRLTRDRLVVQSLRRVLDARLFDALDDDQLKAAEIINRGFRAITQQVAIRTMKFDRVIAGESDSEWQHRSIEAYRRWLASAPRFAFEVDVVLDVIVLGKSLRETDRDRRRPRGFARLHLTRGLDAFCQIVGWKRKT